MLLPSHFERPAAAAFALFMMFFCGLFSTAGAQTGETARLSKDTSHQLEIPKLRSLAASDLHLYALSESDGLVVFRVHADSLQWLYSSESMQRRGNRLQADTRFAYLTGRNSRLTIVEPTSVLGVYSSTELPAEPGPLLRKGDDLFLGISAPGLHRLSLRSPDEADQQPERVAEEQIGRARVIALQGFGSRLLALTSGNNLHQFKVGQRGQLEHEKSFRFGPAVSNLFIIDGQPLLSGTEGTIYEIDSDDELRSLFRVNGAVADLRFWNGIYLARTVEGEIWEARPDGSAEIFRRDTRAGNEMLITKGQLWISDYEQVSRIRLLRSEDESDGGASPGSGERLESLTLLPIEDRIVPFPRPVLIPVGFEEEAAHTADISYQLQSSVSGATVREEGFLWQPASRNVGRNDFTIVASTPDGLVDSTSFTVDIRPFNRPPRFNPVRPLSIPVGEEFVLPVRASDPDGLDSGLIRYMGVDLPAGAVLDEKTGEMRWTPVRRQTGEHEFRVIATDQYGAAASLNVQVNVLELERN